MPERSEVVEIAMRRVSRGGVGKLNGHWLDGGRPVPCFLPDALDSLIRERLVTLAEPNRDSAGQHRATLTDLGSMRYAALSKQNESGSEL